MDDFNITPEEAALLARFKGRTGSGDPCDYMEFKKEALAQFCGLKDRLNDRLMRRCQAAWSVIDIIARAVGINPDDSGLWLYAPDEDGTTPITDRMESWFSRSGDKAKLKRRIQELEQENSILRSLLQK